MAPRNRATAGINTATTKAGSSSSQQVSPTTVTNPSTPGKPSSSRSSKNDDGKNAPTSLPHILELLWSAYQDDTPARLKLIDGFLIFLIALAVTQFAYCVLAGTFPFNAFLSGFSATVGQFVLAASLRMQSDPRNSVEFKAVTPERAFGDFVFGSVLLHLFCVNFIN